MRSVVIAAVIGALAAAAAAQPAPAETPAAEVARAKQLYSAAEAAMTDVDYPSAIRDYNAAYDITRDPVLFYKIGTAHEKAGACPIAIVYYRRYIAEAKPTPAFVDITNARIAACAAKPADAVVEAPIEPPAPKPEIKAAPPTEQTAPSPDEPKTSLGGFVGAKDTGSGSGAPPALPPRNRAAWLLVTGSIAFLTVGAVLAYSANSAENDIADLYVGFGGTAPAFDDDTRELYDALIEEGRRYERWSWVTLGLAGVTGGAAAYLFWRDSKRERPVVVTPTATPSSAGVSATIRF